MSGHDLTEEEIQKINKEINGFMFEPAFVDDVSWAAKKIKYVTGKKAEVWISIRKCNYD